MKRLLTIHFSLLFFLVRPGAVQFLSLFLDKGLSDAVWPPSYRTSTAFMWFGTPNGLNRYDAYSIKTFYAGQHGGLPSNNIISLYAQP
jgi:hypothetical protein